jgi:hypothetical protein
MLIAISNSLDYEMVQLESTTAITPAPKPIFIEPKDRCNCTAGFTGENNDYSKWRTGSFRYKIRGKWLYT